MFPIYPTYSIYPIHSIHSVIRSYICVFFCLIFRVEFVPPTVRFDTKKHKQQVLSKTTKQTNSGDETKKNTHFQETGIE